MAYLTEEKQKLLQEKAREIRETIIHSLVAAGSGHTAGPLRLAGNFSPFFFFFLHLPPHKTPH